jgi:Rrf2 family transcriptional regulator, cysteine metabolism repressor
MKISTRSLYCLRLMIYLADEAARKSPITLKEIAQARGLSHRYLEQLVVPLKTAGLITSVQGKRGGYVLARAAKEISALDVIEATSGEINLIKCVQEALDCSCDLSAQCPSRRMWVEVTEKITETLGRHSLHDLSERRMLEVLGKLTPDETPIPPCDGPEKQGDH